MLENENGKTMSIRYLCTINLLISKASQIIFSKNIVNQCDFCVSVAIHLNINNNHSYNVNIFVFGQ